MIPAVLVAELEATRQRAVVVTRATFTAAAAPLSGWTATGDRTMRAPNGSELVILRPGSIPARLAGRRLDRAEFVATPGRELAWAIALALMQDGDRDRRTDYRALAAA